MELLMELIAGSMEIHEIYTKFQSEKLKGGEYFGDQGRDVRIIIKWTVKK
jgi:hypothetical protein